jgi:hypothetical protein
LFEPPSELTSGKTKDHKDLSKSKKREERRQ